MPLPCGQDGSAGVREQEQGELPDGWSGTNAATSTPISRYRRRRNSTVLTAMVVTDGCWVEDGKRGGGGTQARCTVCRRRFAPDSDAHKSLPNGHVRRPFHISAAFQLARVPVPADLCQKCPERAGTLSSLLDTATMSLYASRRCLDIAGRVAGGSNSLSRTWSHASSVLVVHRRCYASPATSQKSKTKPASTSSSTSRFSGKAQTSKDEAAGKDRTAEDELKSVEALHRMSETNEVDVSSAPLELMGKVSFIFSRLPSSSWRRLDVMVPSLRSQKEGATLADHFRAFVQTQRNWLFNIRSCVSYKSQRLSASFMIRLSL